MKSNHSTSIVAWALLLLLALLVSNAQGAVVTITASRNAIVEDFTSSVIRISRDGDTSSELSVIFDVSGTATFSDDYVFSTDIGFGTNNIIIAAGDSFVEFSIIAPNDNLSEPKETVIVTLIADQSYDLGEPSSSTVTIYDDGSIPIISVSSSVGTIAEGGSAFFTITSRDPVDSLLVISFNFQGTATFSTDYTSDDGFSGFPTSNIVAIPANSESVVVSITSKTDFVIESLETVILTLLESDNYAINTSPATIDISDIPPLPQVSVSASVASLEEDSLSTATFTFTRTVNLGPAFDLKFNLEGVALLGSDYDVSFSNPVQGENTISFAGGQNEASFTVSTKTDTVTESDESVLVTIVDDAAYLIVSPNSASIDIIDSPVPTVTITAQDNLITETSNSLGVFVITRTGNAKEDLTVNVVFEGSATFTDDYTTFPEASAGPATSPVTISKESNTATFAFEVVPDSLPEGTETVVVSLSLDSSYILGDPSSATITIEDPPLPIISIQGTPSTLVEDSGSDFTLTVHRDGDLSASLTVDLNLQGTATIDVDYTTSLSNAVAGVNSVTFAPGSDTAGFTFTPVSDGDVENFEAINIEIVPSNAYTFGETPQNKVDFTITDPGFVFPEVTITVNPAQIAENSQTPATFTFSRTGSTEQSLSVFFTASGTATLSNDFSYSLDSPVIIPAGSSSVSFDVTPVFDTVSPESTETVIFSIVDNFTYTVGSDRSATLEILNVPFPPSISIQCDPTTLAEASGTSSTFTLTRNLDLTVPVTVKLEIKGTATIDVDYVTSLPNAVTGSSNSITFDAGADTVTFTVTPLTDDVSPEDSETVVVAIFPDSAYSLSEASSATFVITNTLVLPEVSIASNVNTIAENAETSIIYTVTRTRDTSASLSVLIGISGTATLNADYTTSITFSNDQATLVIPAGSSTGTLTVTPIYDGVFPENTETVVASILQTSDYNLGSTTSKSVSITDVVPVNFPVISITSTPPSLTENTGASATFVLTRTGSLNNPLAVTLDLSGAAVLNLDYSTSLLNIQAGENTFTFEPGANEIRFSVTPFADAISPEDNEDVTFEITQSGSYLVGSPSSATLTIVNSPPSTLPTLSITATPTTLVENANRPFTFTITRSGGTTASLLVVNLLVSGAATPLDDYTSSLSNIQKGLNTIIIPAGSTTVTFTVTPVDDTVSPESNENVVISLAPSSAYIRGTRSSVSVTILDNVLPLPVVTISTTATTFSENSGQSATITIARSGLSNAKDLSVDIVISGSANLDTDYLCDLPDSSSGSNIVVIPAGSNAVTFKIIPLVDSNSPERTETVEITLLENAQYTISGNPAITITITDSPIDNTLASVSIGVSPNFLAETTLSPAVFTITRTGDTGSALVVNINLSGTASFGTDYTVNPPSLVNGANTITISPGAISATFSVTAAPDNIAEASETVEVSIRSGSTYSVGAVSTAILTITNGDVDPNRSIVSLRTISQTSIAESTGSNFQFSIERTVTTNTLTVQFTLSGSATINTDYTVSGASVVGGNRFSVTFAAGASTAAVSLIITNDAIEEKDESILVGIQSSSSYSIGAPSSITFTIRNDDSNSVPPTVTFEVVYVTPGTPSFRFNITNTQGSTALFSFTFVLSSTELTINVDFDLVPRSGITSVTPIASNRRNTDSRFQVTVDLALGPGQGFVYVIDVNNKVPATATEKKPLSLTASVLGQESVEVKFFRTSVSSNAVSSAFNSPNSPGANSSPSVVQASPMGPADSSASSIVPSSIVVFSVAAATILSCVL